MRSIGQFDCKMGDRNWRKYTSPPGSQISFLDNYNGDANKLYGGK